MAVVLFLSVLLIAACGLIYELIAGTLASYLLGDSVLQFSTVIGTYLFAMGLGSAASRYLSRSLIARFVEIELMVAMVGGFSSSLLFLAFAYTHAFDLALYLLVIAVGILVGLEIPLLMRILEGRFHLRDLVSHVLTFDYLGALGASIAFPLWLVPKLGLVRAALLFGVINAAVALWSTFLFRDQLPSRSGLRAACGAVLLLLGGGMAASNWIQSQADNQLFADEVIFERQTRYQRIVVTRWKDDIRLFLNSHLQFSSRDEYRYHESLVHPGLSSLPWARRALVLGGGDGLAVRELLKYPNLESITLVDLDPEMIRLFTDHPMLAPLNGYSFRNPRVHVINADAFPWLEETRGAWDFVVVDFPDPTSYSLGKLYTSAFYRLLKKRVAENGLVVVQSTSPMFSRQSYWCVVDTLHQAGFQTWPYHVYVPSFGEWGFTLAGSQWHPPSTLPAGMKFLTVSIIPQLFDFPEDMKPVQAEVNRLNDQILVRYYEKEWKDIAR
ncbi:MAG TPA: polyamine aminopropyltransferase [Bryobacteraceae bacterium]|jgi:spermidine synthase|nr:polyamine aminopropyltransferase [Bryobacteraceae bacterium]